MIDLKKILNIFKSKTIAILFFLFILTLNLFADFEVESFYNMIPQDHTWGNPYLSIYDYNEDAFSNSGIDKMKINLKLYSNILNPFYNHKLIFAVDKSESRFALILISTKDTINVSDKICEKLEDGKTYYLKLIPMINTGNIISPDRFSMSHGLKKEPDTLEYVGINYKGRIIKQFKRIYDKDNDFFFYIQVFTSPNLIYKNNECFYIKD